MSKKKPVPKMSAAPKPGDKVATARQYARTFKKEAAHNQSALAKKMYEETKPLFKSIESARYAIRYAIGQAGNHNRTKVKNAHDIEVMVESKKDYRPNKGQVEGVNAKILILDIETAPLKGYFWSLWKQNIGINQITDDWFCFTWSAKWLFEDKVFADRLTPKEAIKQDDKRIMKSLWSFIDQADLVIAHNGKKFDIPKINTRFLVHRMNPPSPYQVIDTLITLKKEFGFASNKLDYVNRILKLERKLDTGGFELWDACYRGDAEALQKMEEYNMADVRILEQLYLELRPWIKPHPNMNLFILDTKESRCPTCGSKELEFGIGTYRTYANNFEGCRCKNCGAIGRRRLSNVTVNERRHIIYSVPK